MAMIIAIFSFKLPRLIVKLSNHAPFHPIPPITNSRIHKALSNDIVQNNVASRFKDNQLRHYLFNN